MYVTSQANRTLSFSSIKLNRRLCDDSNKLLIVNKLRSCEVQIPFFHTRFRFFFCDWFFSSSTICVAVMAPPSGLVRKYKQAPDKLERWLVEQIYSVHFYINLTNSKNKILSLNYDIV